MVTAKLAFVLIQVGTNLWVNPMQLQGIKAAVGVPNCDTLVLFGTRDECSDWSLEQIKIALSPAVVAKALEGK